MLENSVISNTEFLIMPILSCGIDFGTSNSTIAVSGRGLSPELVKLDNQKVTTPSTVFYKEDSLSPLFGEKANLAYMNGEQGRFMRSLKRVLGTDLMDNGTLVNDKLYNFSDILVAYIKHLKVQAEKFYEESLENLVMGRPVHFRDNDEKGDRKAESELHQIAKKIGFKNINFQFEPIAAAFAHENNLNQEILACVVDIGGGTSDFTIIRLGKNLQTKADRKDDILASSGVRVGGNDFDKDFSISSFMPEFGSRATYGAQKLPVPTSQYFDLAEWSKINSVYGYKNLKIVKEVLSQVDDVERYSRLLDILKHENGHRLLNDVENSKIILTDKPELEVTISYIAGNPTLKVTKKALEKSIKKDLEKISKSLLECLKIANVKADDIGLVILTGGSTEIPIVQDIMHIHFPQAQFSTENKMSSVGLGLAFDAKRIFR